MKFDKVTNRIRHNIGTKFIGPFPIRIIIWFHQRYVLWACEKYINGTDFGDEEADTDKQQAKMRRISVRQPKCRTDELIRQFFDEFFFSF